ncbi:hypothetical protein PVW47_10155 [Marinovum sp. SP66]|nr:hypothetical protein [Marinovum sp. SP66]MDD9740132.1 hypothetical protein [Marinovum sp. SP66]
MATEYSRDLTRPTPQWVDLLSTALGCSYPADIRLEALFDRLEGRN